MPARQATLAGGPVRQPCAIVGFISQSWTMDFRRVIMSQLADAINVQRDLITVTPIYDFLLDNHAITHGFIPRDYLRFPR